MLDPGFEFSYDKWLTETLSELNVEIAFTSSTAHDAGDECGVIHYVDGWLHVPVVGGDDVVEIDFEVRLDV